MMKEILLKGKVTVDDFRKLYPSQKEKSLRRTANHYMKPLVDLGIAERDGDGWKVRADVLRLVSKFEEIRKKLGFKGDLYDFVSEVFTKTRIKLTEDDLLSRLAKEHGVSKKVLEKFVEGFLDSFVWKTEEDLMAFSMLWEEMMSEVDGDISKLEKLLNLYRAIREAVK